MADPIAAAFPNRPLAITVRIPRWKSWLLGMLGLLLIGGGVVAITWDTLPALLSDHEIRARAVPLAKVQAVNGWCQVRDAGRRRATPHLAARQ